MSVKIAVGQRGRGSGLKSGAHRLVSTDQSGQPSSQQKVIRPFNLAARARSEFEQPGGIFADVDDHHTISLRNIKADRLRPTPRTCCNIPDIGVATVLPAC